MFLSMAGLSHRKPASATSHDSSHTEGHNKRKTLYFANEISVKY